MYWGRHRIRNIKHVKPAMDQVPAKWGKRKTSDSERPKPLDTDRPSHGRAAEGGGAETFGVTFYRYIGVPDQLD